MRGLFFFLVTLAICSVHAQNLKSETFESGGADSVCDKTFITTWTKDWETIYNSGNIVGAAGVFEAVNGTIQPPQAGGFAIKSRAHIKNFFDMTYAGGLRFDIDESSILVVCAPGKRFHAYFRMDFQVGPSPSPWISTYGSILGIQSKDDAIFLRYASFGVN